jgi:hypothetical protein
VRVGPAPLLPHPAGWRGCAAIRFSIQTIPSMTKIENKMLKLDFFRCLKNHANALNQSKKTKKVFKSKKKLQDRGFRDNRGQIFRLHVSTGNI